MTEAMVKKILESPTRKLRAEATSANAIEYATLARTLFGLEPHPGPDTTAGSPAAAPAD